MSCDMSHLMNSNSFLQFWFVGAGYLISIYSYQGTTIAKDFACHLRKEIKHKIGSCKLSPFLSTLSALREQFNLHLNNRAISCLALHVTCKSFVLFTEVLLCVTTWGKVAPQRIIPSPVSVPVLI